MVVGLRHWLSSCFNPRTEQFADPDHHLTPNTKDLNNCKQPSDVGGPGVLAAEGAESCSCSKEHAEVEPNIAGSRDTEKCDSVVPVRDVPVKLGKENSPAKVKTHTEQFAKFFDPELARNKDQLLKCCASLNPGKNEVTVVSNVLESMKSWLAQNLHDKATDTVLCSVGDGIAQAEYLLRSTGQVQYWTLDAVQAYASLLSLYEALLRDDDSPAATRVVCRLVFRPCHVELLKEYSDLVLFGKHKGAQLNDPQLGFASSEALLNFLVVLVKFLACNKQKLDGINDLCWKQLGFVYLPPHGVVPRMLQEQSVTGIQSQILTLQSLMYQAPDNFYILDSETAQFYINYHYQHLKVAGTQKAAAITQLTTNAWLFAALVAGGGKLVQQSCRALELLEYILKEYLSDEVLPQTGSNDPRGNQQLQSSGQQEPMIANLASSPKPFKGRIKFKYTWDLEEDCARIEALEEQGYIVDIDGFDTPKPTPKSVEAPLPAVSAPPPELPPLLQAVQLTQEKPSLVPKLQLGSVDRGCGSSTVATARTDAIIISVPPTNDSVAKRPFVPALNLAGVKPGIGVASRSSAANSVADSAMDKHDRFKQDESSSRDQSVASARSISPLTNTEFHARLLELVLNLLVSPDGGSLCPHYFQLFPEDNGAVNVAFSLMRHFNAPSSLAAVDFLAKQLSSSSSQSNAYRLLRLLARSLFDRKLYTGLGFMAHGAYGDVYKAKTELISNGIASSLQVIVKTIDLPQHSYDRCVLQDVYAEATIMDRFRGQRGICQIYDYGVANDSYWLVMKKYRCHLAEWRKRQPSSKELFCLYLAVLGQICEAVKVLANAHVVHFDLKCANVLLDPLPGVRDAELWSPSCAAPPFSIVLADFGEARAYQSAAAAFTSRNRGTEVFKSPEMLLLNNSKQATTGPGLASDVWSLGCLAYELFSGQVLFGGDYATVTHRVAFGTGPNLQLNAEERRTLLDDQVVIDLIESILVRDPSARPTVHEVCEQVKCLLASQDRS